MKKFVFWLIWVGTLFLIPVTVLKVTSLPMALTNRIIEANLIQRIFGLAAFILLFFQVILGAFMSFWKEKLGTWIFKFHIRQGIGIYTLVLLHPIFLGLANHFSGHGFDPFFIFTDVCVLCHTFLDFYYTLGRVAFWILTLVVFAGLFQVANPWLRKNWQKLHVLNYVVFLIVGLHGFFLGTDFRIQPFFAMAVVIYVIILAIVIFVELPRLHKNFVAWLRS
jgi:sulfoxide reductase heme-binding subunit YedZ